MNQVRIGTRNSALARWQAEEVARLLTSPDLELVTVPITTSADKFQDRSLNQFGGIGAFSVQLEWALLEKRIDVAVHSLKDLPTVEQEGLTLGAILPRDFVEDAWISRDGTSLANVPAGATIGTSSIRRKSMLLSRRLQDRVIEWRGNLDTRLRKLEEQPEVAGIILSRAGLERMTWKARITEVLPVEWFVPAPGQGVVAVQCRREDTALLERLGRFDDPETRLCITAERKVMSLMGAGCYVPLGAYARREGSRYIMDVALIHPSGHPESRLRVEGEDAVSLAVKALERINSDPQCLEIVRVARQLVEVKDPATSGAEL